MYPFGIVLRANFVIDQKRKKKKCQSTKYERGAGRKKCGVTNIGTYMCLRYHDLDTGNLRVSHGRQNQYHWSSHMLRNAVDTIETQFSGSYGERNMALHGEASGRVEMVECMEKENSMEGVAGIVAKRSSCCFWTWEECASVTVGISP